LKRILGVVVVAEDPAANAPNHRPMPSHEGCKSRLVTAADVVIQQLPIGLSGAIAQNPAKVMDDSAQLSGHHVPPVLRLRSPST
jgi:hypothetical protein